MRALERLAKPHERCAAELASLPPTLIHGEFFPSNVIVGSGGARGRICPLDWETAAVGPGPIDVAALAAGAWSEEQKLQLLRHYHAALTARSVRTRLPTDARFAFDLSRLHLAVRMLGWADARDWVPPEQHAFDWLAEGTRLARKIGF